MFHLHFDGTPELRGHVCQFHKDIAQGMFCPDEAEGGSTGDCRHVQHQVCDCDQDWPCVVCPDGGLLDELVA